MDDKPTPISDQIGGSKGRVLSYLERNPKKTFTAKQIAMWMHLAENTALKYLVELKKLGHVVEVTEEEMAAKKSQWQENRRRLREGKSLRKKGGKFVKPRGKKKRK